LNNKNTEAGSQTACLYVISLIMAQGVDENESTPFFQSVTPLHGDGTDAVHLCHGLGS
jgi:hypothetical protein